MYHEARDSLERAVALSPLMEKGADRYIAARRSDAAYYCNDLAKCIEYARESKSPFHERVADRLAERMGKTAAADANGNGDGAPADALSAERLGKRVVLPVGFVRQHHMTCAPATLSALSRFWSMPVEHLPLAEEICYDGTPAHGERNWAERSGWLAREFTITWDTAVALLDRGVPFTLTTVEPTSAHLQAVIGYDDRRGTLLVRDPSQRVFGEFLAGAMFERYKSSGPRGMVFVPRDKAGLLDGIDLPDAALYDKLYDVLRSLVAHDRPAAESAWRLMAETAPNHRLTLTARRSLASYDADAAGGKAAVEALLEQFPDDGGLQLARLSYLRLASRRDERLAVLEGLCEKKDADPVFWVEYSRELRADAREHAEALRLARRALRYRPLEAPNYHAVANLLWDDRQFEAALPLYRFATTLGEKVPAFAQSYFIAARHFRQAEEALRLLRDRFARFGRKSADPAQSLFWALEGVEKRTEALAVLDEALAMRGDDAGLLLFAANARARHGHLDAADELLSRARDRCRRTSWLRASAEIAGYRGELAAARDLWRQVAEAEPLAIDAHRELATLLAQTEGPAAALEHLRGAVERFPHSYPLHQLLIERLRDEGPAAQEPAVRRLIEIHPADGWARRELVIVLYGQIRLEEAAAELEEVMRVDPLEPSSHHTRGKVLGRLGRWEEARAAFREAIRLSVDDDFAIYELVNACNTPAERREALEFVRGELVRQTIYGDGLLAYRANAQDVLEPDELLASLREALAARPDLWHAWSAVTRQLVAMDRLAEAAENARQATERFPLLPVIWLDLAAVCRARGESVGEPEALRRALAISPGWSQAVRQLAEHHDRRGEFEQSRALMEQAVARDPPDAANHGFLAEALWKLGEKEAAVQRIRRAVQLEPGYQWAWDMLRRWSEELDRPELAAEAARELCARRAGEARSWLVLARTLARPEDLQERLDALARAAELYPRSVEAHEQRARLLAEAGRLDEAKAACRPEAWGGPAGTPPPVLRAREAWILARTGDLAAAIAQMKQVLEEDPGFYWGWGRLLEWYTRSGDQAERLKAAALVAARWPHDVNAQAWYGDALLTGKTAEDRAAAKAAYRRAAALSPDYEYATAGLFDLHLEDGELEDAAAVLAVLQRQSPGPRTRSRAAQLAARRGEREAAMEGVVALCTERLEHEWPLEAAVQAVRDAGWDDELGPRLRQAVLLPDSNAYAAEMLVHHYARAGRWDEAAALTAELEGRGDAATEATAAFLRSLADAAQAAQDEEEKQRREARLGSRLRRRFRRDGGGVQKRAAAPPPPSAPLCDRLRQYIAASESRLKAVPRQWGMVTYALQTIRDYPAVIRWMADWQEREGVEPWMLVNLSEAYRALGRDAEGRAVNLAAFEKGGRTAPRAEPTRIHQLWLAADAAVAGDLADAEKQLAGTMSPRLGGSYVFLAAVVGETVLVRKAEARPAAERRRAFAAAKAKLQEAEQAYPKFAWEKELSRFRRKALGRTARSRIGLRNWFWCRWQMR